MSEGTFTAVEGRPVPPFDGLRIGELGALRGKRVDFKRSTVEVAENLILTTAVPRSAR